MADALDIPTLIRTAAQQNGVDPSFALAVAQQESGLDQTAISPKGAVGVFQLMPDTAKGLGVDPHDVRQNITGGVRYLKQLSDKYGGDRKLTAAAYNAGPGAVDKAGGVPNYKETQNYVANVAGDEDLPDPQAVMAAYGFGGDQGGDSQEGAKPSGAPDNTPSPDDVAKAYGWKGGGNGQSAPKGPTPIAPQGLVGQVTGFMANVNRGLGIGDEMAAGFRTAGHVLSGQTPLGQIPADFTTSLARQRALETGYQQADPHLAALAQGTGMAGTMAVPFGQGTNALLQGSRLGNMARGAVTAGLTGAAYSAADAGTPQERLQAASGAALNPLNYLLGAAGGALAPAAARAAPQAADRASILADKVAAFDQAGVRPTLAAVGGKGYATVAKTAAENPIAGIRARGNISGSLADTEAAATRTAEGYGTPMPRASAGEAAQAAIQDYAKGEGASLPPDVARTVSSRDVSFGDKANALYTRAERLIGDTQQIGVPNTENAIQEVMGTFDSPTLAQRFKNTVLEGIGKDIAETGGQISWRDAKNLRTQVRMRLMGDPQLAGTVNDAQVGRIYAALTQDMRDGAAQLGGQQAARAWDQANTFYKVGRQQIDDQLSKIFDAPSGEAAYDTILRSAGSKGGADIKRLLTAKRAIGDGWGDIAATAAQRLGTDESGAFSVNRFVSNYNNLSEAGKNALFGSLGGGGAKATQLKAQLDNLINVAGMQKDVEAAANHSKTAVSGQTLATVGGLANPHTTVPTLGLLGTLALSGEAMTNPVVVRWLAGMASAKTPQALQKATTALASQAQRNPALAELYRVITAKAPQAAGVYGNQPRGSVTVELPDHPELGVGVSAH